MDKYTNSKELKNNIREQVDRLLNPEKQQNKIYEAKVYLSEVLVDRCFEFNRWVCRAIKNRFKDNRKSGEE